MGLQVSAASFLDGRAVLLAWAFTAVAVIGKLVCGAPAGKVVDRISIVLGMVLCGEVELIFASIGRRLRVVDDSVFSALVVMIMITTLITPPSLKWSLSRQPASA